MTMFTHFQASLFEDESTCLPPDSLVSHSQPQENEKDETRNAISFRRSWILWVELSRPGASLKMFADCFQSNLDEYMPRLSHHWKGSVSRSSRIVFQLQPSTHRTGETGSGLLPVILNTPNCMDSLPVRSPEAMQRQMENNRPGRTQPPTLREQIAMLPTPQSRDHFPAHTPEYVAEKKAQGHGMANLNDTLAMLPTPTTQEIEHDEPTLTASGRCLAENGNSHSLNLADTVKMLPTPQAIDGANNGKGRAMRLKKDCNRDPNQPGSWRGDLKDHIAMLPTPSTNDVSGGANKVKEVNGRFIRDAGTIEHSANLNSIVSSMLPTPSHTDYKGPGTNETGRDRLNYVIEKGKSKHREGMLGANPGSTLRLEPAFVEFLMGFPTDYTSLEAGTTE